jgi:hypothetical protein
MTVHAAIGEKPQEMQGVTTSGAHGGQEHRIFEERAIVDALIDAHDILVDDASRADVEMADFAVAHLAHWKPDPFLRGLDQRARVIAPEPVEHRSARETNGVGFFLFAPAPAVHDDENRFARVAH